MARKSLYDKGLKACFKLYKDLKTSSPPIKTILHVFDHTIKPLILYGCENWCITQITEKRKNLSLFDIFKEWEFEKLNNKFCKYILGVSKYCTNIGTLSELGRFPMYIDALTHFFMYWHRLENSPSNLLDKALNEYKSCNTTNSSWYANIIFFSSKLGLDLEICKRLSKGKLKSLLKKHVRKNFLNTWKDIKIKYSTDKQGKLDLYFKHKNLF